MNNLKWFQWLLDLDKGKLAWALMFIGMSYLYLNLRLSNNKNDNLIDSRYREVLVRNKTLDSLNTVLKAENIQFYKDQIKKLEESLNKIDTAIKVNKSVLQDNTNLLKRMK